MCGFCGSGFTQSGSLKTHLTKVHGMAKVEFRCPLCDQLSTSNMGELRNHTKRKHHYTNYPVIVNNDNLVRNSSQDEVLYNYDLALEETDGQYFLALSSF